MIWVVVRMNIGPHPVKVTGPFPSPERASGWGLRAYGANGSMGESNHWYVKKLEVPRANS